MDNETNKKIQLRKKAEELVKTQIDHTKDKSGILMMLSMNYVFIRLNWNCKMKNSVKAHIKLEDFAHKYFDLYNFAPVGYFTLDKDGIILDVNLAGSALLRCRKT